jgi:hypothetical protein
VWFALFRAWQNAWKVSSSYVATRLLSVSGERWDSSVTEHSDIDNEYEFYSGSGRVCWKVATTVARNRSDVGVV